MSVVVVFFFFKQKTAYEMRISDWSSDVCSSDLIAGRYHDLAACGGAVDGSGDLVAQHRILGPRCRPQQLGDRGVEHPHARIDRRAFVERAEAVDRKSVV